MSRGVEALAPAKLNVGLEVLGKRADGFHELRTVMVCLELADRVRATPRDDGRVTLRVRGPAASDDVPTDATNLAARAARAWLDAHRETRGVDLDLVKDVPSQAGLGGGSSDAAAALLATSYALELPTAPAAVEALLAELGSDCVFFASAAKTGAALCEGRGERVSPRAAPSPPWHVSLVVPDVRVATARVFAAWGMSLRGSRDGHSLHPEVLQSTAADARPWMHNDLESSALEAYPELRSWRRLLDEEGFGLHRLTGSGATFYGLYDEPTAAMEATRAIEEGARARGLRARASFVTRTAAHGAGPSPGQQGSAKD